jgi:hypothetical protein
VLTATTSIAAIAGTACFVNISMVKSKCFRVWCEMGGPSRSNFLDIAAQGLILLDSASLPPLSVRARSQAELTREALGEHSKLNT